MAARIERAPGWRVKAAFYCVADERYFLGALAMVNSLRLLGHDEPIHLLDCGLTATQRRLLAAEAIVVAAPDATPPWLLKTVAPLADPADVVVLIDADMIVTRNLAGLIARVAGGGVLAFRDRQQRHFAAWGELLGGGAAIGPRPYVSSGFVILGGADAGLVLGEMERHRDLVDFERTFWRRNEPGYPFLYADQDVLNAVLSARRGEISGTLALESRLAATPPYRRLKLLDERSLRCAYADGTEPYMLHQFVRKPWLEPMYHGIYSRLLTRLLLGDDVAVSLGENWLPRRMRSGAIARADRIATNTRDLGRFYLGDLLPGWIGSRVETWRRSREAVGPRS